MDLNSKIQALPKKEKYWYDLFDNYCKKENKQCATSYEIKLDHDIENDTYNSFFTKDLTLNLTRLHEKGILGRYNLSDNKTGLVVFYYPHLTLEQAKKMLY